MSAFDAQEAQHEPRGLSLDTSQGPEYQPPLRQFKVVFLGEHSVGKTSLITRFMYDGFECAYQATVGIDFVSKIMYLEDQAIRLQLWDTAGQERFRSLIRSYIRDCTIAVVVYDITDISSFKEVDNWIETVRAKGGDKVVIMLVGNKIDLNDQRQISTEQGKEKSREFNVMFIETSAKTGYNVKNLFQRVATAVPFRNNSPPPQEEEPHSYRVEATYSTREFYLAFSDC